MTTPSTKVSRLNELQSESRSQLDELLDSTPLATVALVRDGHPVIFPTGFARIDDELVIHGSTGSPWMRAAGGGCAAAVSVTGLDGIMVARSAFESSFRYRSAVVFGVFERVPDADKVRLPGSADRGVPARADRRAARQHPQGTRRHPAAAAADRRGQLVAEGQRRVAEDPDEDIAGDAWAGVVPMSVTYGAPLPAPDLRPGNPGSRVGAGAERRPPSVQ